MPPRRIEELLYRFNLKMNQTFPFSECKYQNLHWFLGKMHFGFGDLRPTDIEWIQLELRDGEEFIGWNEHRGKNNMLGNLPMIRITNKGVKYREDIIEEEA